MNTQEKYRLYKAACGIYRVKTGGYNMEKDAVNLVQGFKNMGSGLYRLFSQSPIQGLKDVWTGFMHGVPAKAVRDGNKFMSGTAAKADFDDVAATTRKMQDPTFKPAPEQVKKMNQAAEGSKYKAPIDNMNAYYSKGFGDRHPYAGAFWRGAYNNAGTIATIGSMLTAGGVGGAYLQHRMGSIEDRLKSMQNAGPLPAGVQGPPVPGHPDRGTTSAGGGAGSGPSYAHLIGRTVDYDGHTWEYTKDGLKPIK